MNRAEQILEERKAKDLAYIQNPAEWIYWPACPLVQRSTKKCGILIEQPKDQRPIVVYLTTLFEGNLTEKLEYDSFEAVIADDWRVD